jgi:hypothetical protein
VESVTVPTTLPVGPAAEAGKAINNSPAIVANT